MSEIKSKGRVVAVSTPKPEEEYGESFQIKIIKINFEECFYCTLICSNVLRHIEKDHKAIKCKICGLKLKSKEKLIKHMTNTCHKNVKPDEEEKKTSVKNPFRSTDIRYKNSPSQKIPVKLQDKKTTENRNIGKQIDTSTIKRNILFILGSQIKRDNKKHEQQSGHEEKQEHQQLATPSSIQQHPAATKNSQQQPGLGHGKKVSYFCPKCERGPYKRWKYMIAHVTKECQF